MRLLVISHPAVLPVNQEVYRELARRGTHVTIIVPARWHHEYALGSFAPTALPGLEGQLVRVPVALSGSPQRHFHLMRAGRAVARLAPDIGFVEAEPYSIVAAQWALAFSMNRLPFGVQCYENIDRWLPSPVRALRRGVLRGAAFTAARSDTAADLVRSWGARGHVALVPPPVPGWQVSPAADRPRPFTVGYAGRLAPEKGIDDLLAAVRRLDPPIELVLAGTGELRSTLEGQAIPGSSVRVLAGLKHERMATAYSLMDVLVLPSRTTPRWKEQFGRVLIEALWCGVPVVGSDSGEIPWLIRRTGGGMIFPEGNVEALSDRLAELRTDAALRAKYAADGRAAVERLYTVAAATDAMQDLLQRSS